MEIKVKALSQHRCVKGLAELVGQVASTTNYIMGASTISAIIMTQAIIVEACKSAAAGLNGVGSYMADHVTTTNIKSEILKTSAPTKKSIQLTTIFINGEYEIGELMEDGHVRILNLGDQVHAYATGLNQNYDKIAKHGSLGLNILAHLFFMVPCKNVMGDMGTKMFLILIHESSLIVIPTWATTDEKVMRIQSFSVYNYLIGNLLLMQVKLFEKTMMSEETGQLMVVYDDYSDQRSLLLDDRSSTKEYDIAYEFYSEFAKRNGFSIRRHHTEGKDGVGKGLTRGYFVCHRAGHIPIKALNENKPQRNRRSSRCNCQAYMRMSKTIEFGVPEWRITGYANNHNHELLETNQLHFLRAYHSIFDTDKNRILIFAKTEISVQQMMRLMELEKCMEPRNLPFTEKNVQNLLQSLRKVDPEDESNDLLRMCRNIKDKDQNFQFEFALDSNNRLENIAWSCPSSIQSYEIFGDAVVFYKKHRLTTFDMPLGISVGMNNYGMPCFFGCVLLKEENLRSYSWALKAFLGFMNGKAPQTILKDQNMCLKEAISMEMPTTEHALCIWLIVAKFPSWFNVVLGEHYNEWNQLYNLKATNDFELG